MTRRRAVLVGELVVDVTTQTPTDATKVRFGGVFHAVRGAWACDSEFDLAFFSPAYLDDEAEIMAKSHNALRTSKIGNITGTPNVMLIADVKESGAQGYEHLLRDHAKFTFDEDNFRSLVQGDVDVVILSGNFDLVPILSILAELPARVHLDLGGGPTKLESLESLARPLSTLFLSTSSTLFPELADNLSKNLRNLTSKAADRVILKENRGGARLISPSGEIEVGSQRRDIVHSVGVGDVFDVVYVLYSESLGDMAALTYASWIAAEYAATTFPDDFKRETQRTLKLDPGEAMILPAVRLRWEERHPHQIYIAAPDFDYINQRPIDELVECLRYHNFSPRLPVRENGQAQLSMSPAEKLTLYQKDLELLEECSLLIAVNIHNDPGTLIEVGMAVAKGIPVIVYDPYGKADNVMLVSSPELVSSSLDKVVTAAFDLLAPKNDG